MHVCVREFWCGHCNVVMSHVRPFDERKYRASLLSLNIAQFCQCEKVSALLMSTVLTGLFTVYLGPKVTS